METTSLFRNRHLGTLTNQRGNQIVREIEQIPEDVLLNTPTQDILETLTGQYCFHMIELAEPSQKVSDVQLNVSGDPRFRDEFAPGKRCTLTIPFQGEELLLDVPPSTFTQRRPRGHVGTNVLTLIIDVRGNDRESLKREIESELQNLNQYLDWLRNDVRTANIEIRKWATEAIDQRKSSILANRDIEAFLAFPVKARSGVESYAVPLERKVLPSVALKTSSFTPHPTVSEADYDHILNVLQGIGVMMERARKSFGSMQEEDLRHLFLAALNTHFVEQATGETFNAEGKTDILIRHENGGILFVAECKVWDGPKSLANAVDQILSYLTWRESKAAILIFNRDRQISTVVDAIPKVLSSHPQWKRTVDNHQDLPSAFRYIMRQPSDSSIEVTLTILAFDLPKQ